MTVIAHPRWIEKSGGVEAVDRHFQLRGYDTLFVPGSRFLHVEPKSREPEHLRVVKLARPKFHWFRP